MARVVVVTDQGEEVGEVPVFELTRGTVRSRYGFDGVALTAHLDEARRREEVAAQVEETAAWSCPHHGRHALAVKCCADAAPVPRDD